MDYKELLNRCKTKPGWLSSNEQKEAEARLKYRTWVNNMNEEFARSVEAVTNKSKYSSKT